MAALPTLEVVGPRALRADLVVVPCAEGEAPQTARLPLRLAQLARELAARRGWRGEDQQAAEALARDARVGAVALRGLGKRDQLDAYKLRAWLIAAVAAGGTAGARRLAVVVPEATAATGSGAAERVLRDLLLAAYRFDRFLERRKPTAPRALQVVAPPGQEARYRAAASVARLEAEAIAMARDLANTPPNEADPRWMEARARELARSRGMRIRVLGPPELRRLGMGGILAVGGGSAKPPRLVRLEWGRGKRTVALVGKGVTFDTGGISIKPAAAMDEMKYDKCGACNVLGILRAAADLELPLRLRAYLPLVENMPDGTAYRPGDILRCHNGKTVEVTNTDAEGRLILADALAFASAEKPDALLEYSTLTGAVVVALGQTGAGLYTPDDALAASLLDAAAATGERLWRLPLWPEFGEEMKGTHADLRNSGGRWGGANNAAAFLANFVNPLRRWAHLDIAGPAYVGADGHGAKGATGYGIATTLAWLRSL